MAEEKFSHRLSHLALLAILVAFALTAFASLRQKSATIDEYGYLPAAYNLISTRDLRFSEWHTPLVNALLGVPLIGADVEPVVPPAGTRPEGRYSFWNNGDWFAAANPTNYHALLIRVRLMSLALAVALGVLVYRWTCEIAAPRRAGAAGIAATALTLFHPEVLAHSRLATLDIGLTFFFTFSLYVFHRYLRAPGVRRALIVGVALGLAQSAKFTSVLLVPVILSLPLVYAVRPTALQGLFRESLFRGFSRRALCGHMALIGSAALLTLNATYLFQNPMTNALELSSHSERMTSWQRHWPDWLAIPLPAQYARAVDRQFADQERHYQCYLHGETIRGGRIDYFAALLWAKTPLAGVLLLIASAGLVLARRLPDRSDSRLEGRLGGRLESYVLLVPALLVLLVFSLSNKQIGLRMVLPLIPLVAIWMAGVSPLMMAGRRWTIVMATAVIVFVASSLSSHPHYLSYFNVASGGTEDGYKVGLGSNYDWGQDLPALRDWMQERGIDHVNLLYYGRIDPSVYGIDYAVPRRFAPGDTPLVVSASHYGMRYPVPDHGERRAMNLPALRDQIFENETFEKERITPTLFVFGARER